jgi:hypothetical protein
MTRATNARIAGVAYLFYIGVAFPSMLLSGRATSGVGMAAKLATMAQHATDVRLAALLSLLGSFAALVLAVTLYAVTHVEDADLALLALTCRIAEGVTGAASIPAALGLLSLAMATPATSSDPAAAQAIGAFVLDQSSVIGATFFAVGSTIFCWLLLRGRMIPIVLAWIGVVASLIVAIGLPLQLLGIVRGAITQLMWLPMAAFEIPVGIWFIVKGVRPLGVSTGKGGEQSWQ